MMQKREKELLDQLFTAAQNLTDYMHKNGYSEVAMLTIYVDKDDEKYDSISVSKYEYYKSGRTKRCISKDMNCTKKVPVYTEDNWEDKDGGVKK